MYWVTGKWSELVLMFVITEPRRHLYLSHGDRGSYKRNVYLQLVPAGPASVLSILKALLGQCLLLLNRLC